MSLRFLHLNVQELSHIERICAFLELHEVDVLCLQEVSEDTVHTIKEKYGYVAHAFVPMFESIKNPTLMIGVAIVSKQPISSHISKMLIKADETYKKDLMPEFQILKTDIIFEAKTYTFLTTHLPVNYPGSVISEFQMKCYEKLKEVLLEEKSFVLTGDFNSPRGTYIFDDLALRYKDNVPASETSTIDPVLHRDAPLDYVVDGIFTSGNHAVSNIEVHEGLSDHKGITGVLTIS